MQATMLFPENRAANKTQSLLTGPFILTDIQLLVKGAVHMSLCWFDDLISTLLIEFQLTELSLCHGDHHLAYIIILKVVFLLLLY